MIAASDKSQTICLAMQNATVQVAIRKNKRNRKVQDYVKLSPSEFMAWWMTSTGANRKSSNILLHYMKYKFNAKIPTDYRTLLKTPVTSIEQVVNPGSYIHVGVHKALSQLLSEAGSIDQHAKILMQFFVDGLQIFRSSKDGFWVIMMNLRSVSKRRLTRKVIGVYYGMKKVTDFNDFLWAFVVEVNEILDFGIEFDGKVLLPKILNFVLDAPARTSAKAVKAVSGYFGCDYCTTEGFSGSKFGNFRDKICIIL